MDPLRGVVSCRALWRLFNFKVSVLISRGRIRAINRKRGKSDSRGGDWEHQNTCIYKAPVSFPSFFKNSHASSCVSISSCQTIFKAVVLRRGIFDGTHTHTHTHTHTRLLAVHLPRAYLTHHRLRNSFIPSAPFKPLTHRPWASPAYDIIGTPPFPRHANE